jgi:hypothetical protein
MAVDPRQEALNLLLQNAGAGRVAANPTLWDAVVKPMLTAPLGDHATAVQNMWNTRNAATAANMNSRIGGYSAALNALEQQNAAKARGGRRRVTGGTSGTQVMTPVMTASDWFDQLLRDYGGVSAPPTMPSSISPSTPRNGTGAAGRPIYRY